jgi:hypothetical protein
MSPNKQKVARERVMCVPGQGDDSEKTRRVPPFSGPRRGEAPVIWTPGIYTNINDVDIDALTWTGTPLIVRRTATDFREG